LRDGRLAGPFGLVASRVRALGIVVSPARVIAWREEFMSLHEIVLPETKPETEWILGRAVQKVSPFRKHARLQLTFGAALLRWAEGRGEAGSEWRFRLAPAGEIRRPLVPDLAYVSNERLAGLEGRDLDAPPLAPDIAVEILSPGDRIHRVEHKIALYLTTGASLVIVVDPSDRSVRLHDARERRVLRSEDVIEHAAMPGFRLALPALFSAMDRPQ
jgi:Uma2 family endonuclease